MSKIDDAVNRALAIANDSAHGYDQGSRWGPDYDCSSFIITVWEQAGVKVKSAGASYTGNMRGPFLRCGFEDVTGAVDLTTGNGLQRGDVLLNYQSHTAMYIGGGRIVHASINENRGTAGGMSGDQTGGEICTRSYYNYPWNAVLRYRESGGTSATAPETPKAESEIVDGMYTVKQGDTLWGIAEKFLGSGNRYYEIQKLNGLVSTILYVGKKLKIPGQYQETESKQSSPAKSTESASECVVAQGDTLWGLAQKYLGNGARYKEIKTLNGLASDIIYPGQKLKLPK